MDISALVLPGFLTAAYLVDSIATARTWREVRDVRSFRNFLRALGIELGVMALFVRALAIYIWPPYILAARFVGEIAYGGLLVIGVYILWTRVRGR